MNAHPCLHPAKFHPTLGGRALARLLLPPLILCLGACQSIDASKAITPLRPAYLARQSDDLKERLDQYVSQYDAADSSGDLAQARMSRNNFIAAGTTAIDEAYFEFEKEFKALISAKNASVDSVSIILTTAAAVFDGSTTKTVLAAIDTSLKGINTAVDRHTLREKTIELLNSEMRRQRAQVEAQTKDLIAADDDAAVLKFSLEDARRQLVSYFYAGSVTNALTTLAANTAAGANAAEAFREEAALKSVKSTAEPTRLQKR